MIIDIFFLLMVAFALFKGFSKGFIVAIFSFLAFLIGLAAAMKLSVVVAHSIKEVDGFGKWWPAICFVLVFIAVVLLVRFVAAIIQKALALATLGWLNILGGVILYFIIFTIILSVVLFYATKLHVISETTMADSFVYPYLSKIGPRSIELLGKVIPVFHGLFADLQDFFGKMGDRFIR